MISYEDLGKAPKIPFGLPEEFPGAAAAAKAIREEGELIERMSRPLSARTEAMIKATIAQYRHPRARRIDRP